MVCTGLSLVIPIYNVEDYLEECIESVISQTMFSELEVLLVNDGSTDSSGEIARKYANKYDNITYFEKENGGLSSARNYGIEHATTKYISFLDSDDILPEHSLEKRYSFIVENDLDMVTGGITTFPKETKYLYDEYFDSGDYIVEDITEKPYLIYNSSSCNKVFKRNLLLGEKNNFPLGKLFEDGFVTIPLMCKGKIGVVSGPCYLYRRREEGTSITDNKFKKAQSYMDHLELNEKLYDLLDEKTSKEFDEMIQTYAFHYYSNFINALRNNQDVLTSEQKQDIFKRLKNMLSVTDPEIIFEKRKNHLTKRMYAAIWRDDIDSFLSPVSEVNDFIIKDKKFYFDENLGNGINSEFSSIPVLTLLSDFQVAGQNLELSYNLSSPIANFTGPLRNKVTVHLNSEDKTKNKEYPTYYSGEHDKEGFIKANIPLKDIYNCDGDVVFLMKFYDITSKEFVYRKTYNLFNLNKLQGRVSNNNSKIIYAESNSVSGPGLGNNKYLFNLKVIHNSKLNRLLNQARKFFVPKKRRIGLKMRSLYWLSMPFLKNKNIVMIGERTDTFQDNSSHLFTYISKVEPDFPIYYLIDKKSPKFTEVSKIGKVIKRESLKHQMYLLHSKIIINSYDTDGYMMPTYLNKNTFFTNLGDLINYKSVFLQHGVTYNDVSSGLHIKKVHHDKIIISNRLEEKFFLDVCQYEPVNLIKSGFPRYEVLDKHKESRGGDKTILLCPTWRENIVFPSYLKRGENKNNLKMIEERRNLFLKSDYFQFYNELLQSKELHELLKVKGYQINFLVHYEIEQYIEEFTAPGENVKFINQNTVNYQDLLINSKVMITDYSSVFFDYVYMNKPVIFAQFDHDDFYKNHYKKGYLDFSKNELGAQCLTVSDVIRKLDGLLASEPIETSVTEEARYKYLNYAIDCHEPNKEIFSEIKKMLK